MEVQSLQSIFVQPTGVVSATLLQLVPMVPSLFGSTSPNQVIHQSSCKWLTLFLCIPKDCPFSYLCNFLTVLDHTSSMRKSDLAKLRCCVLLLVLVACLWLRVALIITLGNFKFDMLLHNRNLVSSHPQGLRDVWTRRA